MEFAKSLEILKKGGFMATGPIQRSGLQGEVRNIILPQRNDVRHLEDNLITPTTLATTFAQAIAQAAKSSQANRSTGNDEFISSQGGNT